MLTGSRGSGKTTALRQLATPGLPGIVTRAMPGQCVRLLETATGEQAEIGRFDPNTSGTENRMTPVPEGFLRLGIPALHRCTAAESAQIVIDEIGYLEQSCPEYCRALEQLLAEKQVLCAVRKQNIPFLTGLLHREDAFSVDLDAPFGKLGCVIMASGLGKRFGGNKLMADFHGRPMLQRALDATEGIFARRVVVTRHTAVAEYCREQGIAVVLHDLPARSDTVRLGLEAMQDLDGCLFCPGDQPLLQWDTVASLALCAAMDTGSIWRPRCGDCVGAPMLFPRWTFPELLSLPEGKGGGFVAKMHPEHLRTLAMDDPRELMDADTPEALRQLAESME